MILKFKIWFLLVFCFIQIQNNIFCPKLKKIKLYETDDAAKALTLYEMHGVSRIGNKPNDYLCESYDGTTNRMNAYSVCKQAATKIDPIDVNNFILSELKIKCKYVYVPLNYKYAEVLKEQVTISPQFSDEFKRARHKMAYCGHNGEDSFYLMHAQSDYYYLFIGKNKLGYSYITACLKLNLPLKEDYPLVNLEETDDVRNADNIYGFFGVSRNAKSPQDISHVCYKISKTAQIIRAQEICPFALEKCKLQPIQNNLKVICKYEELKRFTKNGCIFHNKSRKLYMAECFYSEQSGTKSLMIFNGPRDGYYYVAKSPPNSQHYEMTNVIRLP